MTPQKTYSHLLALKRRPSEYEIVGSRLLYYPSRGFEVNTPLSAWYEKYQQSSPLRSSRWDDFQDPRETTYARYTEIQEIKEIYVDGLLASIESSGFDQRASREWIEVLEHVIAAARYPIHGLHMAAAYLGSMAPSGRILMVAMFQAADEVRRVQRFAYRMRLIQEVHPTFGRDSRKRWQEDPMWQPLRELVERLLATYDWGEAFVALSFVVKPLVDGLWSSWFRRLAAARGDDALARILESLGEDSAWHADWSRKLVELAIADVPENRGVISDWIDRWTPYATRAGQALAALFPEKPEHASTPTAAEVRAGLDTSSRAFWSSMGLGARPR